MNTYDIFGFIANVSPEKRITAAHAITYLYDGYDNLKSSLKRGTAEETIDILTRYFSIATTNNDSNQIKPLRTLASDYRTRMHELHILGTEYENGEEYDFMTLQGKDLAILIKKWDEHDVALPDGYFITIYKALTNSTESLEKRPYIDILEVVYRNFKELFESLRNISLNMQEEIKELMPDNNDMKNLDDIYKPITNFLSSKKWLSMCNLWSRENFAAYRNEIEDKFKLLYNSNTHKKMIQNVMDKGLCETEEEAETRINNMMNEVINYIETYEDLMNEVLSRINKYYEIIRAKLDIIKSSDSNIHGKIIEILKDIQSPSGILTDDELQDITHIYSKKIIDVEKFFSINMLPPPKVSIEIPEEQEESEEKIKERFNQLLKPSQYCFENVNSTLRQILQTKKEITPQNSTDIDLLLLCMAQTYANSPDRCYDMIVFNNIVIFENREVKDFVIKRREIIDD